MALTKKILDHFNCTSERLRDIFTCTDVEDPDHALREKWEEEIQRHVHEGIDWSCKNARIYQAVDLAWDSNPINKATIPLMLYAQGKIDMKACGTQLDELKCAEDFTEYDAEGEITSISLPRLYEISVNLVKSYLTRRVAAQSARFNNLWPYFKYDPRGTYTADKLRGDVLSQRVEIMADQYGYRHFFDQTIRDMFLYGYSLAFPASAWDRQVEFYEDPKASAFDDGETKIKSRVLREGVEFVNPHPTRHFYDISKPLSQINTDTGPDWLGYWDVVRFRDIKQDPGYWNRDKIKYSSSLLDTFNLHRALFNYYYCHIDVNFPSAAAQTGADADTFPLLNERVANIGKSPGTYTKDQEDDAVFLTQYYRKVNPKRDGFGDYQGDVWVRLVVASDATVVFGEFLPSIPAIYGGINQNDSRLVNTSMAHELMPFQDQLSNILSQILLNMKAGLTQIWMINQDVLSEDMREYIKESLRGRNYYEEPKALLYSARKASDLGIDTKKVVEIVQVSMAEKINEGFRAIVSLLQVVERLMILSPTELGQPLKSESTATEVQELSNTTETIYSYISNGIDEQRSGAKKLIYESLLSHGTEDLEVPVLKRYTRGTIESAGFEVDSPEDATGEDLPAHYTVMGALTDLKHDYVFSSRDGAERQSNPMIAQTLTQLLGQLISVPELVQAIGKNRIFEMINEIFRTSGTGFDLNIELEDGESEELPNGNEEQAAANTQKIGEMEEFLKQLVGDLQQLGVLPEQQPGQGSVAKAAPPATVASSSDVMEQGAVDPQTQGPVQV